MWPVIVIENWFLFEAIQHSHITQDQFAKAQNQKEEESSREIVQTEQMQAECNKVLKNWPSMRRRVPEVWDEKRKVDIRKSALER